MYIATVSLVRADANIFDEFEVASYAGTDITGIKRQFDHDLDIHEIVHRASGETLDPKPYEADMRHLIDLHCVADEPRKISAFDSMSIVDLIVKTGIAEAIASPLGSVEGNSD